MCDSWVPRHYRLWCPATTTCPFQHGLNVLLGLCKKKGRKSFQTGLQQKEALSKNAEELNQKTCTRGLEIFQKSTYYLENSISQVKNSLSVANCEFFLQLHAFNQAILTKKTEFHTARPSIQESTIE